jgi:hypothetical protein
VDDPEQGVRLSFTSSRCRWTSSAIATPIINRNPDQSADIEVLEKIKLNDGDAFRAGDDGMSVSSHAGNRQESSQASVIYMTAQVSSRWFTERAHAKPRVKANNSRHETSSQSYALRSGFRYNWK